MLKNQNNTLIFMTVAVGFMVTACGGNKPETGMQSKPALKVNGHVINDVELQIKSGMQTGNRSIRQLAVSGQVLENVVGSELMRQAALDAKLDQDPVISARIADSTRRILALAYVDQLIGAIKKPTNEDIEAYYAAHPQLYAQRMQYELRDCVIQLPQDEHSKIQAKLAELSQFETFEKWLTENKVPHQTSPNTLLGDQLPEELAEKIISIQPGGHLLLPGKNNGEMRVVFLLTHTKSPLTLNQAKLDIEKQINDQRRKDALGEAKKSLREKAKIEYIAPYTENGFVPDKKTD